jgi:hypothetical protein
MRGAEAGNPEEWTLGLFFGLALTKCFKVRRSAPYERAMSGVVDWRAVAGPKAIPVTREPEGENEHAVVGRARVTGSKNLSRRPAWRPGEKSRHECRDGRQDC